MDITVNSTTLSLTRGDITTEKVEVIVNAANEGLRGGGGVDGAIHTAGGPSIMDECRRIGRCPTGTAVLTGGGNLSASYVIHTVGPIYSGGTRSEEELLQGAYHSSLTLAKEKGLKSVAFPSISTGVYGYPIKDASVIALKTTIDFIKENPNAFTLVSFCLFSDRDLAVYTESLRELTGS
ncbi:MAG: O-acetyl-ADP-ribose deacetylase [Deltaproteobacteria bacterium]|nr:O-acetyl-ADP-ribose deacetylase [Deltaproteobacteria bacterium]